MSDNTSTNKEIAKIFTEIARLLDIKGKTGGVTQVEAIHKPKAYRKAAKTLVNLSEDVSVIYQEKGLKGIKELPWIGEKQAAKIVEYIQNKEIGRYEQLKKERNLQMQQVVTHYFETKGLSLNWLKQTARMKAIQYQRFAKRAEELLELAGSVEKANEAMDIVAAWANSRNLDYAIETVFKKWLELDKLKPKEVVKKPFFRNMPMIWSEARKKWYVIDPGGEWLEFAGKKEEIEWRISK